MKAWKRKKGVLGSVYAMNCHCDLSRVISIFHHEGIDVESDNLRDAFQLYYLIIAIHIFINYLHYP